ncbi:hypothetical protein PpBr36_01467 [Pyricularia pennisetigena]|uniref:hypothetical protein n=1 Tax=Pyricularia pennisetigena TaxID=1578925 RepID=UPI00114D8AC0|nr:hypothetical protein PpBr36_01467 [Pyricularia pennisetigena]TLS29793.1 hypothetical protein PpBr36_01467 [Pyricularia pennisetigena]
MGKKKRSHPDVEELLARPWCYYCERDFEDLKLLISHQKAKHFKCDRCGRRLNTAGGLAVHMNQVHKESLDKVENALPNRDGLDIEIFGMEGVPEDMLAQHRTRIITNYYEAQEARRAATGNPPPGQSGGQGPAKKIKIETPEEIKKRLAEHKARRALGQTNGNSGSDAPNPAQSASPGSFSTPFNAPPQYGQPGYNMQQYPGYPASALPTRPPGVGAAAPQALPQRPPYGAPGFPPSAGAGMPSTLDDLVSGAAQSAGGRSGDDIDKMIRLAEAGVKPAGEGAADPKSKKDKSTRMMVANSTFSLEELMVQQWTTSTGAAIAV